MYKKEKYVAFRNLRCNDWAKVTKCLKSDHYYDQKIIQLSTVLDIVDDVAQDVPWLGIGLYEDMQVIYE